MGRVLSPEAGRRLSAPSRTANLPVQNRLKSLDHHELVGKVIGDKYRVLRLVGSGGMGTVYEMEHIEIGRHVAAKVLAPANMSRQEAVARFQREARAAGSIGHPNICEVYDVGKLEDGSPYLVMEMLTGRTLAARLHNEGPLPLPEAVTLLTQVLSALHAAHKKKIIHRDIKPANIFLTEHIGCPPSAKILDFGISKTTETGRDPDLTHTGMVMGTPYYMAPEQARGKKLDHRVDLYACGVMLYEILTGKRPFVAKTYNALVVQMLSSQPRDPRELRPEIPKRLVLAIYKAMAKQPENRFEDAAAFIEALAKSLDTSAPFVPSEAAPKNVPAEQDLLAQTTQTEVDDSPTEILDRRELLEDTPSERVHVEVGQASAPPSIRPPIPRPTPGIAGVQRAAAVPPPPPPPPPPPSPRVPIDVLPPPVPAPPEVEEPDMFSDDEHTETWLGNEGKPFKFDSRRPFSSFDEEQPTHPVKQPVKK